MTRSIVVRLMLVCAAWASGSIMRSAEPQTKIAAAFDIEALGESHDSFLRTEFFLLKHRDGGAQAIKVVLRNTSGEKSIMIRWARGVLNAFFVILDSRGNVLYNPVTDWELNNSIPKVAQYSILKPMHEITNVISLPEAVLKNLIKPCIVMLSVSLEGEIVAAGAGADLKPEDPKSWKRLESLTADHILLTKSSDSPKVIRKAR